MQVASPAATPTSVTQMKPAAGEASAALAVNTDPRLAQYKVIRRNGAVVAFEPSKIAIAVTKAFLAVNGGQSAASSRVRELTAHLTDVVVNALMKRKPEGGAIHIEEIQDQVELALMRGGEHEVARAYVLYREKRSQERAHEKQEKGGGKVDGARPRPPPPSPPSPPPRPPSSTRSLTTMSVRYFFCPVSLSSQESVFRRPSM